MKAAVLKPHERKKERYALKAFLWGAFIAALFVVPCMIIDKGMFVYYGDYNVQVLPFYQLMSEAIKSGETGWSWYTDLGTSFIGGYSFYNLGSPFFWLMMPFPSSAIPYLMGPLTIIKFGLSSLTAYMFLRRYTKDKNNAVIGSMLYAFSGFAIYGMVFHFIDTMVFFPLLLTALDSYIYDGKRGYFALMVGVCAAVNYYFFAAEVVFCLIYFIVRMVAKSYHTSAKEVVYLFFEALVGVGLASFILIPSVYHIVGSNRLGAENMNGWDWWFYNNAAQYGEIITSFFMPPERPDTDIYVTAFDSKWKSITAFLPLFGMTGVFAIIFNKRKNKWLRVFYTVCGVFMFVPVLNSSFQMFADFTYVRWFFMLLLIMSFGSVIALEDNSTKWKKPIIVNLLSILAVIAVIGLTPNTITQTQKILMKKTSTIQLGLNGGSASFWTYAAIAMFNLALAVLFVSIYKKNKAGFKRYGALLTSVAIVVTACSTYIPCKVDGEKYVDIIGDNMINSGDKIEISDIQDWRSDVVTLSNYTMRMYDKENVETRDYPELQEEASKYVNDVTASEDSVYTSDKDNLTMFWRIPGLECFHSTVNSSIAYLFDGMEYERTTLSNWPLGMYGIRSLCSVKYMFNDEETDFTFENESGEPIMPGWKYLDTQNGYKIYENEYALPMGLVFDHYMNTDSFERVPVQYKHIALLDCLVVENIDDMFMCAASDMESSNAESYEYTEEEYFQFCKERQSTACYDFKRDKNGFEAKIDTGSSGRIVMFTVPFDNGWSAYVNGEKADIMQVDYGFMAVAVPENTENTIRFNYHTPGKLYGIFTSGVCIVLLIIYLAAMKIQSTPLEEEEKKDSSDKEKKSDDDLPESGEQELDEDITIFDIVKQTEEENMMNVFKRLPVVLENGNGAVAYDIEYKKYIDFTSGIGVNALGFVNGVWSDAVEKQMNMVQHTSNIFYNTTQIQLAEMLCIKTGFKKVFFANSGAEANECAIKLARKYGSDKYGESHTHIVTLENSFHGRTITTLAATGQESFHKHFMPFTEGFGYAQANNINSVRNALTDDTCAVMIELVQGEGGVMPLEPEFVKELAQLCEERDILLIVDEIQTGIGRTGKLFCYERYGIKPDVITSAKALGGGLPLSACLCGEKAKDVMTAGTNGTTFGGNPIACAGAMKIIDIVSDEDFLDEVCEKGEYIKNRIESMKGVKEVRGLGMMLGIVLEKDNAKEVQLKCAENGLLVLTAKNLIRLLPPLNIEYVDIDEGLDILEKTILDTLNEEDSTDK